MLELLINHEAVDLSENASIEINEESPVFEKDSIPGGFSFPFDIPASPRNRRIFGNPDRLQAAGRVSMDLPFELYLDGQLIGTGTANIQDSTENTYKVFFQVGTGDFASKTDGKKLSDVDFGGARPWEFKPEYTYPEDDFALFPVYNENFMDDTQYKDAWAANHYRLNAYENGAWYNATGTVWSVSPYPYLGYVINRLFNYFGFAVAENVFTSDPDLKQLVIYNNKDAANFVTTIRPVTRTIFGKRDDGAWGYIERTVIVTTITREFNTWDLKDSLPDMLIKDFILSIRNLFNLSMIIDSRGFVHIQKRKYLILAGGSTPITHLAIGMPNVTPPPDFGGVYLKWEHELGDLLFSEGFKDIYESNLVVKEPVSSIADLCDLEPEINEIRLVILYGLYYQYAGEEVDGEMQYSWKVFSNDFQNFKTGDKPDEFSAAASTLPMIHYQRLEGGPIIRCPQAAQLSNSILRADPKPCTLRFLFYRGMAEDSAGTLYPYGSSDVFSPTGNRIAGISLSLKWQGETGLYEQLWKDYLTWWVSRKKVKWIITNPSQLEFSRIYEIDGLHYILKSKSTVLTDTGVVPSECEFYLV